MIKKNRKQQTVSISYCENYLFCTSVTVKTQFAATRLQQWINEDKHSKQMAQNWKIQIQQQLKKNGFSICAKKYQATNYICEVNTAY